MDHLVFIEFVNQLLLFYVLVFAWEVCGILPSRLGDEPLVLESEVSAPYFKQEIQVQTVSCLGTAHQLVASVPGFHCLLLFGWPCPVLLG